LRVTSEEREKIFWRNAARLLKLDLAAHWRVPRK